MKIASNIPGREAAALSDVTPAAKLDEVTSAAAPSASAHSEALQSTVLRLAVDALRDMPEIDEARVTQLRDALARGELPFNVAKLAALIETYHRGSR